jgi:hypothetical protein
VFSNNGSKKNFSAKMACQYCTVAEIMGAEHFVTAAAEDEAEATGHARYAIGKRLET